MKERPCGTSRDFDSWEWEASDPPPPSERVTAAGVTGMFMEHRRTMMKSAAGYNQKWHLGRRASRESMESWSKPSGSEGLASPLSSATYDAPLTCPENGCVHLQDTFPANFGGHVEREEITRLPR
eukprot:1156472-Pelagomonas_calceolata.AAC.7